MPETVVVERKHYVRKTARITIKVILYLLLFVILLFLLLLTPPAQRFLTGKVQNYLEKKFQTKVRIGNISFGLSGNVTLNDFYLEDKKQDTLLSGGTVKAHINYLKLFSNEVEVKDVELQNITAKINRKGSDTLFNYQFIVDAFATEKQKKPDTAETAPLKLNVSNVTLENGRIFFYDDQAGIDFYAKAGYLTATIDSLDPYEQRYDIPTLILRNTSITMTQMKPLAQPKPFVADLAEAATPSPVHLAFGTLDLSKVNFKYDNNVSAVYSSINIGKLKALGKDLNLQQNIVYLDQLELNNTKAAIRFGKKEEAVVVKEKINQEVKAEKTAGWDFRVNTVSFQNDHIIFDDDTKAKQPYGLDFAHLDASALNINIDGLVVKTDSVAAHIEKASFKEQSGFVLNELTADALSSATETHFKSLYIKTPGSEIKRSLVFKYENYDAFRTDFAKTLMDIDIANSRIQVKDILAFAPQLRSHPAFANRNAVWKLNLAGSGTMNRLKIETLQFDGLKDTYINAEGLLTGLTNPNDAGGDFTIYTLHTNQTDISLFTGQRLSNSQVNLPEDFDISGHIAGNAGRVNTDLNISTSYGFIALDGTFANLRTPTSLRYNGSARMNGLQLGRIIRQQDQFGTVTGRLRFNGSGTTAETINGKFIGNFSSFGFNRYQYRNVAFNGNLNNGNFNVITDIKDPNADLNLTANGKLASNTYFRVKGMVDSIKLHKLHFTSQPVVFRGKIDADVANLNPDYLDADVLVTDAILVANNNRLPLDSVQLFAARTDSGQLIRLRSDIANAQISGKYRLTDLGSIIQNNIEPYFSVTPGKPKPVSPYDINFYADIVYGPVLSSFIPDLKKAESIHAQGRLATGSGLTATVTSPYVLYQNNEISNAVVNVNTDAAGMHINATAAHIKAGNSFEGYNTRINATALNNNLTFSAGTADKRGVEKYFLSGNMNNPSSGYIKLHLNPDSLLLNYEKWSVSPNNELTISPNTLIANNFTLIKGTQELTLQSLGTSGVPPLQVTFTNFRLGTLTGFMKADSVLIDGVTNGTATVRNLFTQPVFTSNLNIQDLTFRQDTVGNVALQVSSAGDRYSTDATITGKGNNVHLSGYFTPQGTSDVGLDLSLDINRLNVASMQGALKDFVTSASGAISGNVRLTGTAKNPDIKGKVNFDSTSISTIALGGPLTIDNESLDISNDGFVFNDFNVLDSAGNKLTLNGTAFTNNFINYQFNLDVNANHFRVISTPRRKNSLYYGDLYITSALHVGGTEAAPAVDGAITVEDGTNFSFVAPERNPTVVSREGIVQFVDFDSRTADSLFLSHYDSLNRSTNFAGYNIATNITITKDAIFNIVLDPTNGDFVNLQGEALLSAGIDPSGKIALTGTYEITSGAYQISYNFLRRKFEIQPGSKITWLGEPTNAQLALTAVYVANTSPLDLVANYISAPTPAIRNTYLQKLPFQVELSLSGELMKPDVTFDILLPTDKSYPVSADVIRNVDIRLSQLRQEPGELNKQVFSLLLLNRFVGENPFQSSGGGGFSASRFARQSVSKLLTEQLNKLAEGLIDGVDLAFDVVSTDDYTTGELRNRTDLNVGLSKRLLNDRLTITVGSNFELEGPQQSKQRPNNFAGNIAVNYMLSRDGKYMLRLYRKNEYYGAVEGYIIETGLTFIITLDYEHFADLLRRKEMVKNGTRQPVKQNEPK